MDPEWCEGFAASSFFLVQRPVLHPCLQGKEQVFFSWSEKIEGAIMAIKCQVAAIRLPLNAAREPPAFADVAVGNLIGSV
jgi:hypothetical protein